MNLAEILEIHRRNVLRWNRQFSLISRVNPGHEVDQLIQESVESFQVLESYLIKDRQDETHEYDRIQYVDLGSGGGFPGLIWNYMFTASEQLGPKYIGGHLVEPREKRAWFLEQCARQQSQTNVKTHQHRWGEIPINSPTPTPGIITIFSLKALNLDDDTICNGLTAPEIQGSPILIVRFASNKSPQAPGLHLAIGESPAHSALSLHWIDSIEP